VVFEVIFDLFVLIINLLCSSVGITSRGVEVGCDGLSALNKAFET
jgi:hypothetical protein